MGEMTSSLPAVPVVLLHGWPVTTLHWRHLGRPLRSAGFEPVPIALPGLGVAAAGVPGFRKHDLAAWLRAELDRRRLERFAVVGHDWGATVATLLAATCPEAVTALVVEEEILPGIEVDLPEPGRGHYPTWHGPFNRVPGLADRLVPGREDAYYGAFLRASAGPHGLEPDVVDDYVEAYRADGVLQASLGYYRTGREDRADVGRLRATPIRTPVLAIGGRYAMGSAVAAGLRPIATDVTGIVLDRAGHYPLEQQPDAAAAAMVAFLEAHARGGPDAETASG